MGIRNGNEEDIRQLVSLFSDFFSTHDKFQRNPEIVKAYIMKEFLEHDLVVYDDEGILKGALFLVKLGESSNRDHKRWRFRHFAFESERIANELLSEAERRVKLNSKTAKVELNITESEEGIDFYKKRGYEQEGILQNHFRWGEVCFVLGKGFLGTNFIKK
jgi:hypothetical protein